MKKYVLIVVGILFGATLGFFLTPLISTDNIFQQVKKLDRVLNIVSKNYFETIDTQKLTEAAIKGLLNELDPHSVYISAEEMKRVNEDFQGSFEGIGIEFDIINDTILIVSPIPGGPSEALGIQAGDKIVKIDGQSAIGLSRTEVPKKLKGPKGTIVEIDVKRQGVPNLLHFTITRDKIPLNTIDIAFMVPGTDIGIIKVNRFAATTHDELVESLRKLESQGMNKLVLDLRGNPGGYLNQAFLIAEEFLPKGDTIVYTKGRLSEFEEVYVSSGHSRYVNLPLVVLVDAGSASASEIVSGAIQDLDRGLIVGETTFGKGLVQRQYDLGDGSAIRVTIAKYYTPSGRCIQRPYSDKDKYRKLVGRFELEEGSYIYNAYNKIIEQVNKMNQLAKKEDEKISIDSLPIYYTRKKRVVFGGGGIAPDYIIKADKDTLTNLGVEIRNRNLYLTFCTDVFQNEIKKIKQEYPKFQDFLDKFTITDKILSQFRNFLISKDIKIDEKLWYADKKYIELSLKIQIARMIWPRNEYLRLYYLIDKQFQKALELFPEAMKIAGLK